MKNKLKKPVIKGCAKVSVVLQMEAVECGAASLAMILGYYEKWIPLEQLRIDCSISRDGAKASYLLTAARRHGLKAKGYRCNPEQLCKNGKFPCIIHWNSNHFVVLCGFKGNKAYINDPAKGSYTVTRETFDKAFTGICMLFEPDEGFRKDGKPKSILSFAKKRMVGTREAVVFVLLTTTISALLGIINPAFSRVFLDRLLTRQNIEWFYPFLFGLSLLAFITIIVLWIRAVYESKLNGKFAIIANSSFLWHVLRMPISFFSQRMAGDIVMRQSLNEDIADTLVSVFAPLVIQTSMLVFYLVAMLSYSPLLTAIGLMAILVNIIMSQVISNQRINSTQLQVRNAGRLAGTAVAGIEMMETIKASGAENGFFEKWAGYQAGVITQRVKFVNTKYHMGLIPWVVSVLSSTAVLMMGVYLVLNGQFTAGMILAFQGYLNSFKGPVNGLINTAQTVQEMRIDMVRIEDVMEYPTDVKCDNELDEKASYNKLSGELVMKGVTFGYSLQSSPLVTNFDLHLKPGSRVAFVGSSGSGKSTLAKLISGLYKPWSGELLFDGRAIGEINHSIFTSSVAVVDQDIILFEDTIGNNIKMWDTAIEDFEVILAARDAGIHEDIIGRDGGYSYKLLEGGKDLSGGQRQQLEIARVLAQDPTIIIMDEATSALDAKTEFEVVNAIKNRGITCIVIAHRLSTIRDCDEIIVMDQGQVVERGTHDELYPLGGFYTSLVTNE